MSVSVRIPTPLRRLTKGQESARLESTTLSEAIQKLEEQFPGIKARLCDDKGELHRFVNIYVNGEDVRFLQGMETTLKAGDEISIVPAVAGG